MCELGKVLVALPTDACNLAMTERIHNGMATAARVRYPDAPQGLGWWGFDGLLPVEWLKL